MQKTRRILSLVFQLETRVFIRKILNLHPLLLILTKSKVTELNRTQSLIVGNAISKLKSEIKVKGKNHPFGLDDPILTNRRYEIDNNELKLLRLKIQK